MALKATKLPHITFNASLITFSMLMVACTILYESYGLVRANTLSWKILLMFGSDRTSARRESTEGARATSAESGVWCFVPRRHKGTHQPHFRSTRDCAVAASAHTAHPAPRSVTIMTATHVTFAVVLGESLPQHVDFRYTLCSSTFNSSVHTRDCIPSPNPS